jgi:hypothetical protein
MDLTIFGNAVGISDINDWRECPARMADGMRRHTEGELPGHTNWTNAYGSAIHEAISVVEKELVSNEEAIDRVWITYGPYLDPEDLALLREDLDKYRRDTPLGFRLVAAEVDCRVPLAVIDGTQYYFRFKLDALYQSLANPSLFFHRDYKSSKWPKSEEEVHKDPQMSAYNWAIFELYPECQRLVQSYEQLRHGNIITSRNDTQRAETKDWLIRNVKALLADEEMKPKINDFCRYCPKVMVCHETERATTYWRGTLAVLAPMSKEGRRIKVDLGDDQEEVERLITDVLPRAITARKHLEYFEKTLKGVLDEMPSGERSRLGWRTKDRKSKTFNPDGLKRIHEATGDLFYDLISLSRKAVDTFIGKPEKGKPLTPQLTVIREQELEIVGSSLEVPERAPDED